jgi:hypothetical protein
MRLDWKISLFYFEIIQNMLLQICKSLISASLRDELLQFYLEAKADQLVVLCNHLAGTWNCGAP